MGATGLEPVTSTMSRWRSDQTELSAQEHHHNSLSVVLRAGKGGVWVVGSRNQSGLGSPLKNTCLKERDSRRATFFTKDEKFQNLLSIQKKFFGGLLGESYTNSRLSKRGLPGPDCGEGRCRLSGKEAEAAWFQEPGPKFGLPACRFGSPLCLPDARANFALSRSVAKT